MEQASGEGGRQRFELSGRSLAWRTAGEGPPLLLVNGYAATGADWDPTFLAGLAGEHQVICPDNRGLGGSEAGDGEISIEGMAADLEALLEHLAIGSLPVVGWSMGGFIVQALAARSPGRIERMALIASDPGGPGAMRARPEAWSRLTDHSGTAREQARRLIGLLFAEPLAARIDAEFGDAVAAARAEMPTEVLLAQEAAMDAWHERPPPSALPAPPPTLVIHGDADAVIPPANAELLARRWSADRTVLVPGCGHGLMAQEADRLVGEIRGFAAGDDS